MKLSIKERNHYNWQQTTYYEMVGRFVSSVSLLEGFMMETLCIYFSKEKQKRVELFNSVLAATSLRVISDIFMRILKEKYLKFYEKHEIHLKKIKSFIERRNLICHSHFHADEKLIQEFNKKNIWIRDIRKYKNSKDYIEPLSLDDFQKLIQDIDKVKSAVNEFRKQLKTNQPIST